LGNIQLQLTTQTSFPKIVKIADLSVLLFPLDKELKKIETDGKIFP
jgi:hypothetical protein